MTTQPTQPEPRNVLVTGGNRGIGLAIARALKAEGARVMLNGFGDPAEVEKLKSELNAPHDGADLSDPASPAGPPAAS